MLPPWVAVLVESVNHPQPGGVSVPTEIEHNVHALSKLRCSLAMPRRQAGQGKLAGLVAKYAQMGMHYWAWTVKGLVASPMGPHDEVGIRKPL